MPTAEPDPYQALLDDARAREAARERTRERFLHQQLTEDARLSGVLTDLAEHAAPVTLHTVVGSTHRGHVAGVAPDHVHLRPATGAPLRVALSAVAAVVPAGGDTGGPATGGRAGHDEPALHAVLARAVGERPDVAIVAFGGAPLAGQLRAVGRDLVSLRLTGPEGGDAHVPLAAIAELTLPD